MRRRAGPLLAVLLVAAIAGTMTAAVLFARRIRGREIAGDVRRGAPVVEVEAAKVRRIEVARDGADATVQQLERDGEGWRAVAGPPAPPQAVARLLSAALALTRRTTVAGRGNTDLLASSGLLRPRLRLGIATDDGARRALLVGATTGRDGVSYVLAPDETIVLVSSAATDEVIRAAAALQPGGAPASSGPGAPAPETRR